MKNLLDRFREIYNLPDDVPFKRIELEDALIEKFGDIHYNKYTDIFTEDKGRYIASCKNNWGLYEIRSECCSNIEQSLVNLFIKYGIEPEEGTEEFYTENFKDDFHEIVDKVYGQ